MRRVAVLGDVHGNAVALAAVLDELRREDVDLVVWTGDLSWGWAPAATLELVRSLELPARYVRGNAERALLELGDGKVEEPTEGERWMLDNHSSGDLEVARSFQHSHSVDVDGLGATYFCHGSPRSDEELLTSATPDERVRAAAADIGERVLVSGHTHVQHDREVAGLRAVNPGSVGLPYEGRPGAYWALLGPGVELRRTEYDLDEAVARIRASGYPRAEQIVEMLTDPPAPAEAIERAEKLEFSG
ncbi:MAG: metallophosphoesterase family protein [Gaiellaceae bacterium]